MSMVLEAEELISLIDRVFLPRSGEGRMGFLVDLPDETVPDDENWRDRRNLVREWVEALESLANCPYS